MARTATPEQKAKAAERRERFKAIAQKVAELTPEERMEFAARAGIRTIEGRELSAFNQCLLLSQHEAPSIVGGFRQWKTAGRSVRKGEHGLMIWVPTGRGEKAEEGALVPAAEVAGESDAEKGKRSGFIMGTVFDISQTELMTVNEEAGAALAVAN